MNSPVEDIKSRLNIVDVVGEYVRLQKAGAHWKACCPFHNEKSPSFMVNEDKQIYHCFGCNRGGDMFSFVMEIESLEFKEALRVLAEKAGVQLKSFNPKIQEGKNKVLEILELATKFYEKQLWDGPGKEKILKYLSGRGISNESIREFRLGYAPEGWRNVLDFLTGRGFAVEDIAKTGLIIEKENASRSAFHDSRYYDRFRDRIMFPVQDAMGKVVGYSARVAPGGDESQAKYINTPETEVYHKSKILYGIFQAKQEIKTKNFVLLVEGNLDVVASHQAGLKNTVAVSGTALTEDQFNILRRYTDNIKMLFDMDSAGQAAAKKSTQLYLVSFFKKGMIPSVVFLKNGKDAADAVKNDPRELLEAVDNSMNALDYFWREITEKYNKNKPEEKKMIIKEWTDIIANIPNDSPINSSEKVAWSKKLAHEIDLEESVLLDVIKRDNSRIEETRIQEIDGNRDGSVNFSKRSDTIREKMAGLLLADSSLWRKICEEAELEKMSFSEDLLAFILKEGATVGFSYDNLISRVGEKVGERVRKIYFDAKFKFGSDNVEEFDAGQIASTFNGYFEEYRRELQKEKLSSIIKDIKKAESIGDKESLLLLMDEFSKLSKEVK